jgi:hypothetical protein
VVILNKRDIIAMMDILTMISITIMTMDKGDPIYINGVGPLMEAHLLIWIGE